MRLSAPKFLTWLIALIIGGLGIVLQFVTFTGFLAVLQPYNFWLVVVGFVLLLLGNLLKGF